MATRLAQRCRLHLVDEEDFNENASSSSRSWADTEWRRRLWWHVYCSDRISIVVASRPATVHDDDCVVNLPSHDHDWIMGTVPDEDKQPAHINMEETWVPNQFSTRIPDCWWMAIEMYRIGGRIAEFANRRRRPVRPSDLSRRATFDALDKELESIRGRFVPYLEFPPRTEWLLSGYANLGDGANGTTNIYSIYFDLHIMYYGAKIILYRSELPSYTYEKISPEMIQRAKAVCIEAAHKQADVIRWAMESLSAEYWGPHVGIWSVQGASIHVNAALCDDSAIAEQSRRDLEVHLKMHVAADQFYHFNMAMITMLHHVFNLRKKQRLLTANKASGISEDGDSELLIEHENDPDPWIVPRCSSYLGFTYTYSKLHGFLNDAIKQTTYSPPDLKMVESDHYRTLEQANPQTNGPAISMVNALVGDPLQQQPQSRDMDFRRMSVDASMGPPRPFSFDSHNGASHQMWNTGNATGQFTAGSGHVGQFVDPNATTSGAPGESHVMVSSPDNLVTTPSANQDVEMGNTLASSLTNKRPKDGGPCQ
ncbi:hypothetical protein EC988_002462 [Linderina pennispora]|nr:hypothetical protein EC988_002462 [Linderina pennispora]